MREIISTSKPVLPFRFVPPVVSLRYYLLASVRRAATVQALGGGGADISDRVRPGPTRHIRPARPVPRWIRRPLRLKYALSWLTSHGCPLIYKSPCGPGRVPGGPHRSARSYCTTVSSHPRIRKGNITFLVVFELPEPSVGISLAWEAMVSLRAPPSIFQLRLGRGSREISSVVLRIRIHQPHRLIRLVCAARVAAIDGGKSHTWADGDPGPDSFSGWSTPPEISGSKKKGGLGSENFLSIYQIVFRLLVLPL